MDAIEIAFKAGFDQGLRVDREKMLEELKCVNGLDLECELAAIAYYEFRVNEILDKLKEGLNHVQ